MTPATIESDKLNNLTCTASVNDLAEQEIIISVESSAENKDTRDVFEVSDIWQKLDLCSDDIAGDKPDEIYRLEYRAKDNNFIEDINNRINKDLPFSQSWKKERIAEPNTVSKDNAKKVCRHLYKEYNLRPKSIVSCIEAGITIIYKHYSNNRALIVETYNTGEIAALIRDDVSKKTIICEDIEGVEFENLVKVLHEFY